MKRRVNQAVEVPFRVSEDIKVVVTIVFLRPGRGRDRRAFRGPAWSRATAGGQPLAVRMDCIVTRDAADRAIAAALGPSFEDRR